MCSWNHISVLTCLCLNIVCISSTRHSMICCFNFEFNNVEFFTEDWLMDQWMCNFVASEFYLDWMKAGVFFMQMYGVILWHWTKIPFQLSCILKFIAFLESQNLVQITISNCFENVLSRSRNNFVTLNRTAIFLCLTELKTFVYW